MSISSGPVRTVAFTVVLALLAPAAGRGWSAAGHRLVARLAVERVATLLPPFVAAGADRVAAAALDPDVVRLRAVPALRASEAPEHYLDRELLGGAELPADRYEFMALLARLGQKPSRVGLLPYAIVEGTQRLAVALAEYRLQPGEAVVEARVLDRAGVLAHYAADLCQPLHTTIHFDGRARPDGSSPGSGVHELIDALLDARLVGPAAPGLEVEPVGDDLLSFVVANFDRSHALVDRVYELEGEVRAERPVPSSELRAFGAERLEHSVAFTAGLFAAAWALSGDLDLPAWRRSVAQGIAE